MSPIPVPMALTKPARKSVRISSSRNKWSRPCFRGYIMMAAWYQTIPRKNFTKTKRSPYTRLHSHVSRETFHIYPKIGFFKGVPAFLGYFFGVFCTFFTNTKHLCRSVPGKSPGSSLIISPPNTETAFLLFLTSSL